MRGLMCLLTYYPEGTAVINEEALRNGAYLNSDGHGYAIVAGNRLIIRKSMHANSLIRSFVAERARHRSGPALFHSRFSTGGAVDKSNCHPFRLRGDRRTVIAHNGVLPAPARPWEKKDQRSDTRLAADEVFPSKFGFLGYAPNRRSLADWAGLGNKFVILTVNPAYSERSYVVNERGGYWEGGVWYSNLDYQGPDYRTYYGQSALLSPEQCPYCGDMGSVNKGLRICVVCMTCLDCLEYEEDCACDGLLVHPRRVEQEEYAPDDEYKGWWSQTLLEREMSK